MQHPTHELGKSFDNRILPVHFQSWFCKITRCRGLLWRVGVFTSFAFPFWISGAYICVFFLSEFASRHGGIVICHGGVCERKWQDASLFVCFRRHPHIKWEAVDYLTFVGDVPPVCVCVCARARACVCVSWKICAGTFPSSTQRILCIHNIFFFHVKCKNG